MFANLHDLAMAASYLNVIDSEGYTWTDYDRAYQSTGFTTDEDTTMRGRNVRWLARGAIFINGNWKGFEQDISERDVPSILQIWKEELPRDKAIDKWAGSISRRLCQRLCQCRKTDYDNYTWPLLRRKEQFSLAYSGGRSSICA